MTLAYQPFLRQRIAHASPADILCYGGAAGGGKSEYLLMEAFVSVCEHPGNVAMLMRRTFPELEASVILRSHAIFPKEICKYNDQKHRWEIKAAGDKGPKSYIFFGFCEKERDVYKYQSSAWGFLGFDESTHFTEYQIIYLLSRVRSVIPGVRPRVRLCTNPGNVGHGFHKRYFRIPNKNASQKESESFCTPDVVWQPPLEAGMTRMPPTRAFIPSRVFDNPHLMTNDPDYVARLEQLPPAQKAMLLAGEWDAFSGQFFADFDKALHVVKPFEIPRNWKIYRSVDFGFADPFSCHWHAVSENGHVFTFRELYERGLRDREQAKRVKERSVRKHKDGRIEDEPIEYTVGDPAMVAKSKDTGVSTQENYMKEGVTIFGGSNSRVPGWMQMHNFLAMDPRTGTPFWQIFDTCHNVIRELEDAVTDENNPEDLNTEGSDHALDDCRYFFMSRPAPAEMLKTDDASAKLDPSTQAEWNSYKKRVMDMTARGNEAVLHSLNRE